jgi:hypothetical protein
MITQVGMLRLILMLCTLAGWLQVAGQVIFHEEASIRDLLQRRLEANRSADKEWDVWRVQIAATTDRRNMEATRAAFQRKYPGYKLNSNYSEPYYKLQVGAYYHKHRAEAVLHVMKRDYPGAYLVRGRVQLNELTD